ncbi:purine/pyrimidine permease [Paenibacillus sp. LHD-117]|uniref:purine/pyrimidine permease n=1 Tax=Paenibacillus sp. LHD-117 TaxID=3071412 RepID=UPI0027E21016|nr:purine/pyrimidine permease [Paenibacillus sp. LHD-117]MDQ6419644.1 purine/pyrimidine permease [Paenibacillus sp. LHD-117]
MQWFIFMTASSVALPIVIGGVFHLPQDEIASLMQRTFLVVGLSSALQSIIGHRFPIVDGPAGSWVSVFIMMAAMAAQQGQNAKEALQLLQGGMLLAGLLLFVLGVTGLFYKLISLFTPLVTNTFLFILSLQLSGVFLKGMLSLGDETGMPSGYWGAVVALGVFVLVIFLTIRGTGWMRQYAVLLGILTGWGLHVLVSGGIATDMPMQMEWAMKLPEVFAWGMPRLNPGMAVTASLFSLILVSNLIAAVTAARQVIPREEKEERKTFNRSSMIGGVSHGLAAAYSAIGIVPLPVTASFIRMTGQTRRKPFLWACLALSFISFVPGIVNFLAMLPTSVASAVSLATFVQMTGNSFQSLTQAAQTQRQLTILGIGLLVGVGFTLVSASLPQGLPIVLQYALGNGLLIATLLVMALEKLWRPESGIPHSSSNAYPS